MTDTDRAIAEIRAALAAGPTPGEWACYDDSNDGKTSRIEIVAIGKTVARIYRSVPEQDLPNARLIAACSPANIAAILAHVDAQEAEIKRLRTRLEIDQRHPIDGIAARDATIREQDKEIERLRAALRWEQHRAERQDTHGDGCADWGPAHYECAIRERDELKHDIAEYIKITSAQAQEISTLTAERDELRRQLDECSQMLARQAATIRDLTRSAEEA